MRQDLKAIPFVEINENKDSFLIRPLTKNISAETFYEIPHRHSYQEIIYIKKGSGRHSIDGQDIPITDNTYFIIQEGQVHQFIEGINLEGLIIRFTKEFFPALGLDPISPYKVSKGHFAPIILHPDKESAEELNTVVNLMLLEYNKDSGSFKKRTVLQHLLSILVYLIERYRRAQDIARAISSDNRERELFLQFTELVDQYFKEKHGVKYYAQSLGIRPRVLSQLTKDISGYSAKKLILNRIVTESKRLLRFTGLSLKEITYELGLDSPSYFSRMFKDQTGMTPRQYQLSKK